MNKNIIKLLKIPMPSADGHQEGHETQQAGNQNTWQVE